MTIKAYQLFPAGGGFSNDTADYRGESYYIAAESSRQAHLLADKNIWAKTIESPLGIVAVYRRGAGEPGDYWLWCGCRVFGSIGVEHGQGVRALREAMRSHTCD